MPIRMKLKNKSQFQFHYQSRTAQGADNCGATKTKLKIYKFSLS